MIWTRTRIERQPESLPQQGQAGKTGPGVRVEILYLICRNEQEDLVEMQKRGSMLEQNSKISMQTVMRVAGPACFK